MVVRLIIRILANNEQIVQKLSESYVMRRAAQLVVKALFQSKNLLEESGLDKKLTPEQFRSAMRQFSQNLQQQIKQAQDDIKRKMR